MEVYDLYKLSMEAVLEIDTKGNRAIEKGYESIKKLSSILNDFAKNHSYRSDPHGFSEEFAIFSELTEPTQNSMKERNKYVRAKIKDLSIELKNFAESPEEGRDRLMGICLQLHKSAARHMNPFGYRRGLAA